MTPTYSGKASWRFMKRPGHAMRLAMRGAAPATGRAVADHGAAGRAAAAPARRAADHGTTGCRAAAAARGATGRL